MLVSSFCEVLSLVVKLAVAATTFIQPLSLLKA